MEQNRETELFLLYAALRWYGIEHFSFKLSTKTKVCQSTSYLFLAATKITYDST